MRVQDQQETHLKKKKKKMTQRQPSFLMPDRSYSLTGSFELKSSYWVSLLWMHSRHYEIIRSLFARAATLIHKQLNRLSESVSR